MSSSIPTNSSLLFLSYCRVAHYLFNFAVNADECFLTRMQEMSLDYQFVIEQEGGSSIHSFFSFNGSFDYPDKQRNH